MIVEEHNATIIHTNEFITDRCCLVQVRTVFFKNSNIVAQYITMSTIDPNKFTHTNPPHKVEIL